MSIRYDGEPSGGVDSAATSESLGREERSFGGSVRVQESRSTVDAIQAVVDSATNARRGTGKRKGFCVCDRWVIYEGDKQSLKKEMTCGAPQGRTTWLERYVWRFPALGTTCAIHKDGRHRLVERWQTRWHGEQTWTWKYRLILELFTSLNRKHGEVGLYLAQALSGHDCFNVYLRCFKKRNKETCCYCDSHVDNAEQALFVWAALDAHQVIIHTSDKDEGVQSASGSKKWGGLEQIALGPKPPVAHHGQTGLPRRWGEL